MKRSFNRFLSGCVACLLLSGGITADSIPAQVLDPNLQVTPVLTGLSQPIRYRVSGPQQLLLSRESIRPGQARHQRRRSVATSGRSSREWIL